MGNYADLKMTKPIWDYSTHQADFKFYFTSENSTNIGVWPNSPFTKKAKFLKTHDLTFLIFFNYDIFFTADFCQRSNVIYFIL
jgi:hypothetical protein